MASPRSRRLLFMIAALAIYLSLHTYLGFRLAAAFSGTGLVLPVLVILAVAALFYPVARTGFARQRWARSLRIVGSWWLAAGFYALLLALTFDIVRGLVGFTGISLPAAVTGVTGPVWVGLGAGVIALLMAWGRYRALHPVVRRAELTFPALRRGYEITLAFASDLHLGETAGPARARAMVTSLLAQNADAVLLGGDIIDDDPHRIPREVFDEIEKLRAPLGVFAVTGNHEAYHGLRECGRALEAAGVRVLMDEAVSLGDHVRLAGLEDRPAAEQVGREVPNLATAVGALLGDEGSAGVRLLAHHTPVEMEQADRAGVDLMLCGHTHAGQYWPMRALARRSYGIAWGWREYDGGMKLYVSSGLGTWGPPVRIAAVPEIMVLTLKGV